MKKIYKTILADVDVQTVHLQVNAIILSVQSQNNNICIWYLVDDSYKTTEDRTFKIYGTGHDILNIDDLSFIGTVQLYDGTLVFHVFELI